ncbi:hypothetical protein QR680_006586 [Steinernema hermaphroditum]|uniref:N-acetyltransferase domain-containing protein n=1 Tax=Steinernema hermaphroditum TaxID=289476 RepID=A0AA39HYD8_9BILA|nr:hypothetical protein QR680_006586 [Steinernema hermaphroditum]
MLSRILRASSASSFSRCARTDPVRFVRLTAADSSDVCNFLMRTFIYTEPTNAALKLQEHQVVEWLPDYVANYIGSNQSYSARNEHDKIIGVRLSSIVERPKGTSGVETPKDYGHWNVNEVDRYVNALYSQLWSKVPSHWNKLLRNGALSVDEDYGNRGMGRALLHHNLEEVKAEGCKGIASEFTALKSQKIAIKNNYLILHEILHKDWLDEKGNQIIACTDGTDRGFLACMPLE